MSFYWCWDWDIYPFFYPKFKIELFGYNMGNILEYIPYRYLFSAYPCHFYFFNFSYPYPLQMEQIWDRFFEFKYNSHHYSIDTTPFFPFLALRSFDYLISRDGQWEVRIKYVHAHILLKSVIIQPYPARTPWYPYGYYPYWSNPYGLLCMGIYGFIYFLFTTHN